MSKMVIFVRMEPGTAQAKDDDKDGLADPTNVYKLFCGFAGSLSYSSIREADEQEKEANRGKLPNTSTGWVIRTNPIIHMMGGAFGTGIVSRIINADYTFISRNYDLEDDIVIVGFSREPLRALGGLIVSQGLLDKRLTRDKGSLSVGCNRLVSVSKKKKAGAARLAEVVSNLPAFLSMRRLSGKRFGKNR